jgi:hypothetical protein
LYVGDRWLKEEETKGREYLRMIGILRMSAASISYLIFEGSKTETGILKMGIVNRGGEGDLDSIERRVRHKPSEIRR